MKITKKQVFENLEEVENEEKVAIKIKNRFTGSVIYESSKNTYKEAVVDALARGVDLSKADLSGADLSEADLSDAILTEADFRGADLRGADLSEADLSDANLSGANLRGAEMHYAKFYGRGGTITLKRAQLPDFLAALGFVIEE